MADKIKDFISNSLKEEVMLLNLVFIYFWFGATGDQVFLDTVFMPSIAGLVGAFGISKFAEK